MAEVSYFYRQSTSRTKTERQSLALYCACFALMCIVLMYICCIGSIILIPSLNCQEDCEMNASHTNSMFLCVGT